MPSIGLNAELERQREDRKDLQAQIDAFVTTDANNSGTLDLKIAAAEAIVTEKHEALRRAYDGNQIYRLAASWYGVSTYAVTPEQFATARWVFATFSAIAVALAGSVAALVYYASSRSTRCSVHIWHIDGQDLSRAPRLLRTLAETCRS